MTPAEEVRQKCGTVYTWNCAGELYGIECELCEERPLCALNEFAEHMELWHSDWQQAPEDELMQEVLAEQSSGGEVNELKQQLVQELNALDTQSTSQQQQHQHQLLLVDTLGLNEQRSQLSNDSSLATVDNQKLTTEHVQHLIELYRGETRLWNQTHPEFRNMELGRESWRQITDAWSAHCGRSFSVTDVRIRISTLCQRFLKQRERLDVEGELEDSAKFVHYDQLKFLCEQQSLLKRQEHFARENRKLLEIYEHYPILWHNAHKRLRCVETMRKRHEAHRGLQLALRMCDIKLSGLVMQRRLQSLRKRYRLEKIRYLHSVVEGKQSEFVSTFEHYAEMEFLHKHIDPYVCAVCGKIFENLVGHQAHVQGSCEAQSVAKEHMQPPEAEAETEATVGELMVQLEQQEMEPDAEQQQVMEEEQPQVLEEQQQEMKEQQQEIEGKQREMEKKIEEEEQLEIEQKLNVEQQLTEELIKNQQLEKDLQLEDYQQLEDSQLEYQQLENQHLEDQQLEVQQLEEDAQLEKHQQLEENPQLENRQLEHPQLEYPQLKVFPQPEKDQQLEHQQLKIRHLEDHQLDELVEEDHIDDEGLDGNCLEEDHIEEPQLELAEEEIITPLHSLAEACAVAALDEQLPRETTNCQLAEESSEDCLPTTGAKLRVRLSLQQTNKLIELYQAYPNLWDPNHLDYHVRKQRRQAWHNIASQLNDYSGGRQRYSWQMLHRKLTDYTKYYRRERQREALAEEGEGEGTRWGFYEAFSFLDDVLPISCVLQKSLQQRDSNLKIIQVYQSYEQLWCTNHPDYTKRKQRQRQLESLCTRLQEECNLQITVERLKNRLIEFRCQYRQCKEARQAALKRGESWQSNYEYYQQLQFLELHVSPFGCNYCPTSFKRRTDFLRHQRNVHLEELQQLDEVQGHLRMRRGRGRGVATPATANPLEHICHICAMKFSLRTSLLAHLRRHLGQRTHACNECPKKFFNSTALRVHQRSHTKELPYVCEHCARGFVNASKLNQHVKRHAEKRDYPCSRCDKAFYTAHERDRHTRAHLNIRDKVCPYCDRAFVVGSAYYAHLNLHRGEKRYSCPNCGQRFAQYAGLYKHRKRCTANALEAK